MDYSFLEKTISNLSSYIPADIDFLSMLKFVCILSAAVVVIGCLGRVVAGKRSNLNHAVSSAMGILFIYVLTIVIYAFEPAHLSKFLSPLPFISFYEDNLYIHSLFGHSITSICTQILSTVILAFLVNLLDTIIPKGQKIFTWYLLRILTVFLAYLLHYAVRWAFNTFLPHVLTAYAPTILLAILLVMFVLGVLNVILSLILTVLNPIFGLLYAFFFSNTIGRQLTKSILTTIILCTLFGILEHLGYTIIYISTTYLGTYIPLVASLLVLWYLVGHVL